MSRLSRPAWLTTGLLIGAIAVPAVAFAAGAQLVSIRGNDHTAAVTPAGQLRTAEMDPVDNVHLHAAVGSGTDRQCLDLGAASTSRAYILKTLNIDGFQLQGTGTHYVEIHTGNTCGGSYIASATFSQPDTHTIDLGPGIGLPAGTHVSALASSVAADVEVYGYTVQSSDVPDTAAAFRRAGPRDTEAKR